jgi:hypothetical protein
MKKSFCYSGAVLFNSLPQDIRKCQSLPQFKKAINKYYDNVIWFPHGNLVNQLYLYHVRILNVYRVLYGLYFFVTEDFTVDK